MFHQRFTLPFMASLCAVASLLFAAAPDDESITRITLHLKAASPQTVFNEIAKQAKIEFRLDRSDLWEQLDSAGTKIDIDADASSFWAVTQQACLKSGLLLQQAKRLDKRRITLAIDHRKSFPREITTMRDGFLLAVKGVTLPDIMGNFRVAMNVFIDPRLRVVCAQMQAKVDQAIDEQGKSFLPDGDNLPDAYTMENSWVWPVIVHLKATAGGSRTIARLKGSIRLTVQTASRNVQLHKAMEKPIQTSNIQGREILLQQVAVSKSSEQDYTLPVVISLKNCTSSQFRPATNPNNIRLLDQEGHDLAYAGYEGEANIEQARYTLFFTRRGTQASDPATVVWEVPLKTQDITIPFEFTNLPLP